MDKIWIILEREYLQRVKKKSFILSTILTPLIFPIFIAITVLFCPLKNQRNVLSLF